MSEILIEELLATLARIERQIKEKSPPTVSLKRREFDCRDHHLPWITLTVNGNVILDACCRCLQKGENVQWSIAEPDRENFETQTKRIKSP